MALDANSYSSVADVEAWTRHLLDGEAGYSASTRPTLTEVEGFIDDISSILNDAISAHGFSVPITVASPKRSCSLWVRSKTAAMVELTQRGEGFSGEEGSRYGAFWNLFENAFDWVAQMSEGWIEQGVARGTPSSEGLTFTALDKHSERSDPLSSTLEQPVFRRRQFNP